MTRWIGILALGVLACGDSNDAPPALAATPPVQVTTPDVAADAAPEISVLDLEPVDGMPEAPLGSNVVELPGPSQRRPKCLTHGKCGHEAEVWVESREGFVTRWAAAEVRDAKLRKEQDPAELLKALAAELKPLWVPGPVIELVPEGKLEGKAVAPTWLLAARVHVPVAQRARLMLSLNGHARVALNGQVVHEEKGDQYLLPDHRTVPVELAAGWNVLALRFEKISPYAVKLALRLRAPDGLPLSEDVWALPSGITPAASNVCDGLAAELVAAVAPEGWHISARLTAHGILRWPLPGRVALAVSGVEAAARDFDGDATRHELATTVPDKAASLELRVDGDVCARAELVPVALRARYDVARATLSALDPKTLGPGDHESLLYQADDAQRLLQRAALGDPPRRLEGTLAHFEAHVAAAAKGGKPFHEAGMHVRAYRSDYDGTLQRYVIIVPKSYAKGEPAPLVMLAHGLEYTPEDMLRIALAKPSGPGDALRGGSFYKWDPPEPPSGAILVAHDGYGNAGQRAPGEVDVRRVIDEMKAAYRIDPRRVSISGFSLGGSVAFWVPFHAPSVFSAAAPLCGYPNILEYRSVKAAVKKPWEARLLDEDGVAPYAEGGKYLPLKMVHGSMDGPQRSELIHQRYTTLRYPSELDIPPLGHNVWDHAFEDGKLLKWLAARRRPVTAPQPVVRAGRYRWATNYWLAITRFADEALFGELGGAFKGERLQITTKNVAAFALIGAELGERAQKPQTIVVDGKNLGEHVIGERLHAVREAAGWQLRKDVAPAPRAKKKNAEGPLGDVWYGPLVVVYGTQVAAELEANRLTAERLALHAPWIDVRAPVFADVDVSDADLAGKSVVLVGRPAVNLVTRRIEAELAAGGIRFVDDLLEVGGRRFEGPDVGISVIRPSPFGPERYVVLHAGLGIDGTLSARYLPELAPDYLVYDSGLRAVFGDRILGPREVLMGGFFDATWELSGSR